MNTGNQQNRRLIGLVAGVVAGVSYGTNPLFAKPLMESGVPVLVMLFFRYGLSVLLLSLWMLARKESFKAGGRELPLLLVLPHVFTNPVDGVWFSLPISDAVAFIVAVVMLIHQIKKLRNHSTSTTASNIE